MARSTSSVSGFGTKFALGRPSSDKLGGLSLCGCLSWSWSRTARVCPRGAPFTRDLQAALKPPSRVVP
eukprot:5051453-Karenia_brevis.AAC.1